MKETIFDDMETWTVEMSRNGLQMVMLANLTNQAACVVDSKSTIEEHSSCESFVNQLLTFMVRDLERRG